MRGPMAPNRDQAESMIPSPGIHWVIVGGESGPGARPCRVEWIRDIVRQCRDAGVPVFVKQLGAAATGGVAGDWTPQGVQLALRGGIRLGDRKGGDWYEWPADLRVREYPRRTA